MRGASGAAGSAGTDGQDVEAGADVLRLSLADSTTAALRLWNGRALLDPFAQFLSRLFLG